MAWLVVRKYVPHGPEQWDDLLVEWKNDCLLSKANFEAAVAAAEFVFPRFRGHLAWSHRVIAGWAVAHVARHTVPLGLGPACLIAAHLAADGHPRLGLAIVIQRLLGLRPSEVLAIQARDVSLPEHSTVSQTPLAVIGLGIRGGTKAKRAQAVMLRDVLGIGIVRWLCNETPADEPLAGYTYEQYRRLLQKVERSLGLEVGWTPHSPRSGFASELTAAGVPFTELRERGRWLADSSLRTYIDVVTSASIAVSLRLSGLASAIAYAQANFLQFFPGARFYSTEAIRDGREGFVERSGRTSAPTMAGCVGGAASGLPITIDAEKARGESSARDFLGRLSEQENREVGAEAAGALPYGLGARRQRKTRETTTPQAMARSSDAPAVVVRGRGRGRGRGHA